MKFNKIKLIAALCLALGASALGQNNVGTLVTDPIRPFSVNSTNPSAIANEIKGGPFSSSNLAGLSNIPAPRLELGALGYAADTGLYYRLTATSPATWSSINGANITNIPLSGVVGALGYDTNGNVIYDGTNALNFTNVNINLTRGGATNDLSLQFGTNLTGFYVSSSSSATWTFVFNGAISLAITTNGNQFWRPISFIDTSNAAITRTNFGLGWAALTNTSASGFSAALYGSNTNPVLVNTNGQVVSPTNFWQVAPISTIVQYQTNVTGTSTNAATNSRNLFLFSLTPSVSGVTNTVTLPTNTATTFEGDRATIVHLATNSANTVTAIRQLGAATNLITLNQAGETVLLMYRSGAWALSDNISYIEPIYFSGTNAAANAAASRTNLGLGAGSTNTIGAGKLILGNGSTFIIEEPANGTAIITFQDDIDPVILNSTHWNNTNVRTSLGLGATNNVAFADIEITKAGTNSVYAKNDAGAFQVQVGTNSPSFAISSSSVDIVPSIIAYSNVSVDGDINVAGVISVTNAAATRTNLGIPLAALTNTSVTNFQKAIFYTNTAPSNIGGNLGTIAAWIEIVASNGVTYKVPAYTNVP